MGFASAYETVVTPLVREGIIFGPMVCFWFALQYMFTQRLPSWIPQWSKLAKQQKQDIIVRCCSIVNSCLMSVSAGLFITNVIKHGGRIPSDLYATVPYYRLSRVAITSYFVWDIFVCFYYGWSWAWKIHGFCSFIGAYALMFPFSESYAGYYTGCFELSNGFLHASVLMRTISATLTGQAWQPLRRTLDSRAAGCEYMFAGFYTFIRVIGGTYVTGSWLLNVLHRWRSDVIHGGEAGYHPQLHNEVAAGLAAVALTGVQLLQYVWFGEIVKRALGLGPETTAAAAPTTKTEDPKAK